MIQSLEIHSLEILVNYRARNYDAHSGRFMQRDPDAGKLFSPGSFTSKYAYVQNSPISNIDPLGLFKFSLNKAADLVYGSTVKKWHQGLENFWNRNQSEIIATAVIVGAVSVGGPVAAAGLIAGGISAGFTAYGGGDSSQIAKSFIGGFAAGALTASFAGLGASLGGTLGSQSLLGALGGAIGGVAGVNVSTQITSNRWANGTENLFGALGGALGGLVTGATVGQSGIGVGVASGTVDGSTSTVGSAASYIPN